jgi:uncharacterized membrane protein
MNFTTFLIFLILISILVCTIIGCVYLYKVNKNEKFTSVSPLVNLFALYNGIYSNYLNQTWPLLSTLGPPSSLNVSFLDANTSYCISFFHSSVVVNLVNGQIPEQVAYWELSIYDSSGKLYQSYNDTNTTNITVNSDGNSIYNFTFGFPSPNYPNSLAVPNGNYAILIKVISTPQTPTLGPSYLPKINLTSASAVPNTTSTNIILIPVDPQTLASNNDIVESQLWKYVSMSFKPNYLFPGIDTNSFFLPQKSLIPSIFASPFENYLIVFPSSKNVIKVSGILSPYIGIGSTVRSITISACNLSNTQTDSSIACFDLPFTYTIYIAKSETDARAYGYNSYLGDKLLLWNSLNVNPIVVYKRVCSDTNDLSSLDNSKQSIDGPAIQSILGKYYPNAECFNDNSPLASQQPSLMPGGPIIEVSPSSSFSPQFLSSLGPNFELMPPPESSAPTFQNIGNSVGNSYGTSYPSMAPYSVGSSAGSSTTEMSYPSMVPYNPTTEPLYPNTFSVGNSAGSSTGMSSNS